MVFFAIGFAKEVNTGRIDPFLKDAEFFYLIPYKTNTGKIFEISQKYYIINIMYHKQH